MVLSTPSILEQDIEGKTVVLRVDLNSSVKNGKILTSPKVLEHAETIRRLSKRKAKTIILTHQGRKGREDFISLESHAKTLEKLLENKLFFCSWKDDFEKKIESLQKGECLLLENTRFLEEETISKTAIEHSQNPVIKKIAGKADFFVLDALSVAHRSHATVVGFLPLLPSFAGPVLKNELKALEKLNNKEAEVTLVMGGMKPEDSIWIMKKMLEKETTKEILLGGGIGEIAILAKGKELGATNQFFEDKKECIEELKQLIEKYENKISIPVDLAIKKFGERKEISLADLPTKHFIYDIGEITARNYYYKIENSNYVLYNGPFGKFEDYQFAYGTRRILEALSKDRVFSLIGGGDTVTAMIRLGFKKKEFSHVSLAGKALLLYIVGEKLLALEELKKYSKK